LKSHRRSILIQELKIIDRINTYAKKLDFPTLSSLMILHEAHTSTIEPNILKQNIEEYYNKNNKRRNIIEK
jgi:hypothetical protein